MASRLRQISKILFPYFLAIPVTAVLSYGLIFIQYKLHVINFFPAFFRVYNPGQYLESFFVVSRWFSERLLLNFVGTWWFVGAILQFYIIFPVLLYVYNKVSPRKFLFLSFLITVAFRSLIVFFSPFSVPVGINTGEILLFTYFPARLVEFGVGMYLASAEMKNKRILKCRFGVLMFLTGITLSTFRLGTIFSDMFLGVGLFVILFSVSKRLSASTARVTEKIGAKSYSIYLYQEPAMKMILSILFGRSL
ncbi:MAG: acyltransferase family protein [bacterium]|nr:acyltransferase family protein [bacterium]